MNKEQYFSITSFCQQHHADKEFIYLLCDMGIMDMVKEEEDEWMPVAHLPILEKCYRLHYEMNINPEGIEAIHHLLQKMEHLQHEITLLKNQLDFYDDAHR